MQDPYQKAKKKKSLIWQKIFQDLLKYTTNDNIDNN